MDKGLYFPYTQQDMASRLGQVTPQTLSMLTEAEIQSFGITMKKAGYIGEIARLAATGELDLQTLHDYDDDEVCRRLSLLPGIGIWTAEMLMLFSMARPNIFSYGDLAMHRGLRMIYHHRSIDRALFEKYRRRFSPCGSLASFYIWEIAMNGHGYRDYAPVKRK